MDYKTQFYMAHRKTIELGMDPGRKVLPLGKKMPIRKIQEIHRASCSLFNYAGWKFSSDVFDLCASVHSSLQIHLESSLGIRSHLTTGVVNGENWSYPDKLEYETLINDMHSTDKKSLAITHTWLTLSDGSVIDWTAIPWMYQVEGNKVPLEDCMFYGEPGKHHKDHYYTPFLVGHEYLVKSNILDGGYYERANQ